MRNQDVIIKYHDIVESILSGDIREIDVESDPEVYKELRTVRETLCWVLQHPGGDDLQKNFDRLSKGIQELGYKLPLLQ